MTAEIEFFLQGKCNSWLLQPPSQRTSEKLSADQFAKYFRDKIDDIQSSTASADPLVLVTRQVSPLSSFRPATVSQLVKLLKDMPAKSCELDPVPTWLLKQISPYIAPTICQLCNLSLERGVFPTQLKQARVLHLLTSLLHLHWLPVRWRVQFKLRCLMHSIFHGRCPDSRSRPYT